MQVALTSQSLSQLRQLSVQMGSFQYADGHIFPMLRDCHSNGMLTHSGILFCKENALQLCNSI